MTVGRLFLRRRWQLDSTSAERAQAKVLELIPVLIGHLKQHDFYISPPVGNVICAHAKHGNFLMSLSLDKGVHNKMQTHSDSVYSTVNVVFSRF